MPATPPTEAPSASTNCNAVNNGVQHFYPPPQTLRIAAACFAILTTPSLSNAAAEEPTPQNTPQNNATPLAKPATAATAIPPWVRSGELSASWHLPTAMRKGNSGHFSQLTASAEAALLWHTPTNNLYAAFQYSRTDFNFNNSQNWFDDSTLYALTLHYERKLNKNFAAMLTSGANLATEDGARWNDALAGRIGIGLRYTLLDPTTSRERLSLFSGIMVANRYSADPEWLPLCGINYQISKHWNFRTTNGASLTYDVYGDQSLRFEIGGRYLGQNIRLKDDTENGSRRHRALRSRGGMFVVSATKEFFNRAGYVTLRTGCTFLTKYKIVSSGRNLGEFYCDPAATLAIELGLRF